MSNSLVGSTNSFPDYTNCCATIEILIETCLHGCNGVGHRNASSKKVLIKSFIISCVLSVFNWSIWIKDLVVTHFETICL